MGSTIEAAPAVKYQIPSKNPLLSMLGNISAAVKAHRDPKIQNVIVERMIESHLKSKVIGCD